MRFMILVKANKETEAGAAPEKSVLAAITKYHEQLVKAGVLLDSCALHPSSKATRIKFANGTRTWIDGPFDDSELIAEYTIIQVRSTEEAIEWVRRYPAPYGDKADGEIEIRQLLCPTDLTTH